MNWTERGLAVLQRAGNPNQPIKYDLQRYGILCSVRDYGSFIGNASSQKNVMTPQQVDDFLSECHPLALIDAEGTHEQIRKRVERTGQL